MIQKSLEHSLTVGAFLSDGSAAGMARIVTDYATFAYLCDVVVDAPYRGQGFSKAIMEAIMELDFIKGLRRFNLLTASANELYRRYGFTELKDPSRYMEVFQNV